MEGIGSYIDQALVGGILSGVLLLVAATWLLFAQNALWRVHLRTVSAPHFQALSHKHDLVVLPPGFKPQIGLRGRIREQPVLLTLRGGTQGVKVLLQVGVGSDKWVAVTSWSSLKMGLEDWLFSEMNSAEE